VTALSPAVPHRAGVLLPALAHLLLTIDFTIVYVALPDIAQALGFTRQSLQWVVHGYTVAFGGFLLVGGRLADRLGHRSVLAGAVLMFALASLLGGVAQHAVVLVLARALQGFAAALMFPSTLGLVHQSFDGAARARALAVWSLAGPTGLTLGSLLGGVLVSGFGWPAVFLVNVPLGVALAAALVWAFPKAEPSPAARLDVRSATAGTACAALVLATLVQGPETGWSDPRVLACAAGATLAGGTLWWCEARAPQRLIPRAVWRAWNLRQAMALTALLMATFMTFSFLQTLLFKDVLRFDAMRTGLAFALPCASQAVGAQWGGRIASRSGFRVAVVAGFAIAALGALTLAYAVGLDAGYAALAPGLFVTYFGQGIAFAPVWQAATSDVPPSEHGVASALASTTFQLGGALGMALLLAAVGERGDGLTGTPMSTLAAVRWGFASGAGALLLASVVGLRLRASPPPPPAA